MTHITTLTQIEQNYDAFEKDFCVEGGDEELSKATQFFTNRDKLIHRWFHFKEGFSANIFLTSGIKTESLYADDAVFIDPFCGSGTTLVAGDIDYSWKAKRIGFEINPFLQFVANTKVSWRNYNPKRLSYLYEKILSRPLDKNISEGNWPTLSTLHNPDIFEPGKVSEVVDVIRRIRDYSGPECDLLLLGVAEIADTIGFYRKDGRALRILRSSSEVAQRRNLEIKTVLERIWTSYANDLAEAQSRFNRTPSECIVMLGDGRKISFSEEQNVDAGTVSLITYSPPYLNHIDYTEVYKVELWLLGFVKTPDEMLKLRKQTFRSHASYNFSAHGKSLPKEVLEVIDSAATEIELTGKNWHQKFRSTALGYFEDIQQSLMRQFALLQPDGQSICVVANSAHGSGEHRVVIATDLLISIIAHQIGFKVDKLLVARQMRRRDSLNRYLRETVIVMSKTSQ